MSQTQEPQTEPVAAGRPFWHSPWVKPLARLLALAVVFSYFAVTVKEWRFIEKRNLENVMVQSTVVATAAIGATLVIISGGIDLSVGSLIGLSVITTAWFLKNAPEGAQTPAGVAGYWALLAMLAGVALTTLAGCANGILITSLRIVPFIVTLGSMQVVRGLAKGIANERYIYPPPSWVNKLMEPVLGTSHKWMLLPTGVWIMILGAVLAGLFLRYTRLGRHIFAVGSNEQTARLCGVSLRRTKIVVYMLAGFFAATAGILLYSYLGGTGDLTAGSGYELLVIAAVVIGGGSLRGGEGSIMGTIIGAIIIAVLAAGCVQIGWAKWKQEAVTGGIIIAAVAIDQLRHRRMG